MIACTCILYFALYFGVVSFGFNIVNPIIICVLVVVHVHVIVKLDLS